MIHLNSTREEALDEFYGLAPYYANVTQVNQ